MTNTTFFKAPLFLIVEFLIICIVIPGIIIINKWAVYMFFFLWAASGYTFFILLRTYKEKLKEIWNWSAVTWRNLRPILIRFFLASIGMSLFIYFYDPGKMFGLFYYRPEIIPFLLVLYPLISALPQELIFCSYFFKRFKVFFGEGKVMVIMSAVVFAYAHILYINPVAPLLSFLGGLIFASTYLKTRSLALVTIEHGLYGNFLFLIGLGYYFYGGNVN